MSGEINTTLGTAQVLWNLADLYKDINDPALEKDISFCRQEAQAINKEYAGKLDSFDPGGLYILVNRLEKLEVILGKISTLAFLNFTTQVNNAEAGAFLQKIKETLSTIGKEIVFFELEWSKIDENQSRKLLGSSVLSNYQHYLASMRRYAKHHLSQIEETLLIEKAPTGKSSWNNLFDKVIGHMKFGVKQRTEEEVLSDLYNPERTVRMQAAEELTLGLSTQSHILTHIFNTIFADKMIDDRLRQYPAWISSMNLYNELEDHTVETLIDSVVSRYDIPQRYYRIKSKILGIPELKDYDRYAPLTFPGKEPKNNQSNLIDWNTCKEIVLDAFHEFSPLMAETASLFFTESWIHAPIIEGKRGGAFAHPCVPEVHPYIMVNYTGNLRDVSTVAHELGHGIHQYLAAERGYFNSNTPLVLAETASVFGELIVFHSQLSRIKDKKERLAYLCQKLESIFATVFRQVAMNRFEDLVHNSRRNQGELSTESISTLWMQTQKAMFGNSVTLTENYSIWWSYIPHFLSTPGYVYSYAFGELLVLSLYRIYKDDKAAFTPKYIELLKAGGSKTPAELLESFGINLDQKAFWLGGLEIINELLLSAEELAAQLEE
ncbi:MAG: M3 family oligoendopeptidase [Proteobacteria bacterium]|nr:M3 family oligoendopeptidase [Pseudomonadota bacterium]MBU1708538.1 M3 family oligoendopeptidase [Pseudomonadota bacterium]